MKLIRHIIPVDLGNGMALLINSLNGLMDKAGGSTVNTLKRWWNLEEITPENDTESSLYDALKSRGYLVNNSKEEKSKKDDLIKILRKNHLKSQKECRHITFIMTYDCNFCCAYCFEGKSGINKEILTPEQIEAALKLAGDNLQTVGLFGGEPLLPANRPSLEYLISKTVDKSYNITTNGYYLAEFFDLFSRLNISQIMVTLDGEEDVHNKRRFLNDGSPTYQKIMHGIEKYLENGMPICIRMNLNSDNFETGSALRSSLLERFVNYSELLTFEISSMLNTFPEERRTITTELFKQDVALNYEERARRNQLTGRFSPIVNAVTVGTKLSPIYSFCHAHSSNGCLVDPYGYIYPCLVSVGIEELAVGTYYPEITFKEKSIHTRNIESIPKCRDCTYSLLCGGGCPLGLPSYEDVLMPECFSIRNQIHYILPQIYQINEESINLMNKAGQQQCMD